MATSEKKLAANRRNALLSTGPRTTEGKERARANALKHGLCSKVIEVPGEDSEILVEREIRWQMQLNPFGLEVQGYLVHLAVQHSGCIDRCQSVHKAKVAELTREALNELKFNRQQGIERFSRLLAAQPDRCVARLKTTPEGCQFLIDQWELFREPLVSPAYWDECDNTKLTMLDGRGTCIFVPKFPGPFSRHTIVIKEHRDVKRKLAANVNPNSLIHAGRYHNAAAHQADKDQAPALLAASDASVAFLKGVIDARQAELRVLKAKLEIEQVASIDEVSVRARFDASDRGKLMHRYQQDHHRGLYKCLEQIAKLDKVPVYHLTEALPPQEDKPEPPPSPTRPTPGPTRPTRPRGTPPSRRNEPKNILGRLAVDEFLRELAEKKSSKPQNLLGDSRPPDLK